MGNKQKQQCQICHEPQIALCICPFCKSSICKKCFDFPIVCPQPQGFNLKSIQYSGVCMNCFIDKTNLDFSANYDIIGSNEKRQLIFIHGAGSSRKMFLPHAKQLQKKGYRSILIDLPAHGGRFKQNLTLANCIEAIKQAIKLCKTQDITIIGGSLGGYILMEAIGRQADLCKRAIIMMAGQDVGVNRGFKASLGLWAMGKSMNFFSQASFAKMFMQAAANNTHLKAELIEQMAKSGVYFKQADRNIALLKETNPQDSLVKMNGKVRCLFLNGSKDHRDSQEIWKESAGTESRLKVYEGADHFFSHDERFFNRLIIDIDEFINQK